MALTKLERRERIRKRIRKVVSGTNEVPRLSVFRSNAQISVQFVDDVAGKTLLSVSSLNKDIAAVAKYWAQDYVVNFLARLLNRDPSTIRPTDQLADLLFTPSVVAALSASAAVSVSKKSRLGLEGRGTNPLDS